jgi:hypothetical protein
MRGGGAVVWGKRVVPQPCRHGQIRRKVHEIRQTGYMRAVVRGAWQLPKTLAMHGFENGDAYDSRDPASRTEESVSNVISYKSGNDNPGKVRSPHVP